MIFTPDNALIYYGLAGACLLLGFGLTASAWQRPRRRQRVARAAAGALAAGALWLTAYPPLRAVPAARAEAILLTTDYQPDTLRQVLRRLGAGTPVWRADGVAGPAGSQPLGSLLALAEQRPALRRLHVLGRGLPTGDLPQLGALALQVHAPPAFTGFQSAAWTRRVVLGERLAVEGTVNAPTGGPAWLGLQAAGAVRDSVRVPAGGGRFRLRYRPKAAGLALFALVLRQAGRPARTEPVPAQIVAAPRPPVLLLSAAPSFEFKFLRNHLAGQPRAVALRTGISRGLVQTEFLNQPAHSLDRLTPALLARYAVVVADAVAIAGLSASENQALRGAVQAGRLGLVLLADAAPLPANAPATAGFAVEPRPATGPQPLAWPDAPAAVRAALPAALRPTADLRPLVRGPAGALAAAGRRTGLGTVVVSVVPETFRWALQGQAGAYASFWNRLVAAATPPAPAGPAWALATAWPRARAPVALRLAAGALLPTAPPTVRPLAGGPAVQLPLRQDTRLPEWSTAMFWPAAAGWHRAQGPGKASFAFYVYDARDWQGPEYQQRQLAAALRAAAPAPRPTAPAEAWQPWPAGWFFGLFLLAAGYLWAEEKL